MLLKKKGKSNYFKPAAWHDARSAALESSSAYAITALLSSSQPKSDELVFIRISLNPVDGTNAAYRASSRRSEVELYQALASRAITEWSDRLIRSNLTAIAAKNSPQLVRIPPPPRAWVGVRPGTCKSPAFRRLARLEKRLDLGSATRNATPQAPCTELHGRYRTPKQLARYAKNPGKTRVFEHGFQKANGEDRNRTFGCFPNGFGVVRILPLCSISIEVETMRRTTASPTRA